MKIIKVLTVLMLLLSHHTYASFIATTFAGGAYPYSDEQLGIDGYSIEDFEDSSLESGLSVFFGPYTSQGTHLFSGDDLTANSARAWDGNQLLNHDTSYYSVFFKFDNPVSSFGIALSGTSGGVDIIVNNTTVLANNVSSLDNFEPGSQRNAYIRIDAAPGGELIDFVRFDTGVNWYSASYDHLAFNNNTSPTDGTSVPEPLSLGIFLMGLTGIFVRRKAG